MVSRRGPGLSPEASRYLKPRKLDLFVLIKHTLSGQKHPE
jgi:hypothetical protein